jgi:hypothetical protein
MGRDLAMDASIREAIDGIYYAFADAPRPQRLDGCPHCMDIVDTAALLSHGLHEVQPRALDTYVYKAMLTVGTPDDFFYFLPRILELAATDPDFHADPEVIGSRVGSTNVDDWPKHRIEAVSVYLGAVVRRALAAQDVFELDSWVCAVALMNLDVRPFLKEIEASRTGILEYFTHNAETLPQGRLANAFWEPPNPGHDVIVAWFHSDAIAGLLREEYGYVFPDTTQAD